MGDNHKGGEMRGSRPFRTHRVGDDCPLASLLHSPSLMPDESRSDALDHNTLDTDSGDRANTLDPEDQRKFRERVTETRLRR